MARAPWFDVDREGLAQLVARRGKAFVVYELLQNAWDCDGVTRVSVKLEPVPGRPVVRLVVEDDHPNGFSDLAHAYTLFAPSEKKGDAGRRGRFNLGEKLVLALCEHATITTTTGSVHFDADGRHSGRKKTSSGSVFEANVRMTREELDAVFQDVDRVISPPHVTTLVNGLPLPLRVPLKTSSSVLQTDVADDEGFVRRRYRETLVEFYSRRGGEKALLYEMGIPVCEMGDDPYHVNVMQKVPLSMERDSVTPSYLKDIRGIVLDHMYEEISPEQARGRWTSDAIEEVSSTEAVRALVTKRFGGKAVVYDLSDKEANNIATAKGYSVVQGGTFSSEAWEKIRAAKALLPAGKVTPSPKPFHADGKQLNILKMDECSDDMLRFAGRVTKLAVELERLMVEVVFTGDLDWGFNAAYTKTSGVSGTMVVNAALLGPDFFKPASLYNQLCLVAHELGHHYGHHLSEEYHEALCRIGARFTVAALDHPDWFRRKLGSS